MPETNHYLIEMKTVEREMIQHFLGRGSMMQAMMNLVFVVLLNIFGIAF